MALRDGNTETFDTTGERGVHSHLPLLCSEGPLSQSLGEAWAQGRATAKPTDSRCTSADGFAVRMKRTKVGAGLFILFTVFGGEMKTGKS